MSKVYAVRTSNKLYLWTAEEIHEVIAALCSITDKASYETDFFSHVFVMRLAAMEDKANLDENGRLRKCTWKELQTMAKDADALRD